MQPQGGGAEQPQGDRQGVKMTTLTAQDTATHCAPISGQDSTVGGLQKAQVVLNGLLL